MADSANVSRLSLNQARLITDNNTYLERLEVTPDCVTFAAFATVANRCARRSHGTRRALKEVSNRSTCVPSRGGLTRAKRECRSKEVRRSVYSDFKHSPRWRSIGLSTWDTSSPPPGGVTLRWRGCCARVGACARRARVRRGKDISVVVTHRERVRERERERIVSSRDSKDRLTSQDRQELDRYRYRLDRVGTREPPLSYLRYRYLYSRDGGGKYRLYVGDKRGYFRPAIFLFVFEERRSVSNKWQMCGRFPLVRPCKDARSLLGNIEALVHVFPHIFVFSFFLLLLRLASCSLDLLTTDRFVYVHIRFR